MSNLNYNECLFAGRLTSDPELKETQNGHSVVSFRLAVNRNTKAGGADFFSMQAWDQKADLLSKYFKKGSAVFVRCHATLRSWQDEMKVKRYSTEFVVDGLYFVDSVGSTAPELTDDDNPHPDLVEPELKPIDGSDIPF